MSWIILGVWALVLCTAWIVVYDKQRELDYEGEEDEANYIMRIVHDDGSVEFVSTRRDEVFNVTGTSSHIH